MNLVDRIGTPVTVWTLEGNSMEMRTLVTVDEMGVVVSQPKTPNAPPSTHDIFVPWNRIKYIDLPKPTLKHASQPTHDWLQGHGPNVALLNYTQQSIGDVTALEYIPEPGCGVFNTDTLTSSPDLRRVLSAYYTTKELHDILTHRESVKDIVIEPEVEWRLSVWDTKTETPLGITTGTGPARILINTD